MAEDRNPDDNDIDDIIAQGAPVEGYKLLPAWFIDRMMSDVWTFGLVLTTGIVLVIDDIIAVHQDASGRLWLDVTMSDGAETGFIHGVYEGARSFGTLVAAPTGRCVASVAVDQVVMALELADS